MKDRAVNYWITSDTHFNHMEIIKYCGRPLNFEAKLIKGLSQIPATDILIHLGDICIREDLRIHTDIISQLDCKKILVKGNHDRKSNTWYLNHGWDFVVDSFTLGFEGKNILFSHEPDVNRTDYQVHGHYHNNDHRGNFKHKKCFLYAPELFNYQPILLRNLLESGQKQ